MSDELHEVYGLFVVDLPCMLRISSVAPSSLTLTSLVDRTLTRLESYRNLRHSVVTPTLSTQSVTRLTLGCEPSLPYRVVVGDVS